MLNITTWATLHAREPETQKSVETAKEQWVARYLRAFNTGNVAELREALTDLYATSLLEGLGGDESAAAFRMETFRTAGPLMISAIPATAEPNIIWTRGAISGAWIGHQIELDPSGAATRHTIWRTRPPLAPVRPPVSSQDLARSVEDYFSRMAAAGLFSGTVELRKNGQVLHSGAYGVRDRRETVLLRKDTPSNIASVTKLLTSIAILKTVESGKLSLEDTIKKWIPEYPEPVAGRTTLRHLLTHTAGVAFDDDPRYIEEARNASTAEDLLRAQLNSAARVGFPLEFGEYKYSSEHIDLAALMMERATGRPWHDLVREHVLQPAGMSDTSFTPPVERAVGYSYSTTDLQNSRPILRRVDPLVPDHAKPSSHMWSTARDLARATTALVEGRLLGPEMRQAVLEPQQQAESLALFQLSSWVGLGSQGADDFGVRTVGHGGVYPGYSALIEHFPATGHTLTIASNTGEHTAYIAYQRILEMICGVPSDSVCSTTGEEDSGVAAIAAQSARFSQAYVDGDLETLVSIYASDGVAGPPGRTFVRGRDALRDLWRTREDVDVIRHRAVPEAIRVEGRIAYDWGYYSGATRVGSETRPFGGKYLIVWERGTDGVWRMAHDVWNSVPDDN